VSLRQASVGMTGFPTAIAGLVGGIQLTFSMSCNLQLLSRMAFSGPYARNPPANEKDVAVRRQAQRDFQPRHKCPAMASTSNAGDGRSPLVGS
jgi:hypothetical protein